MIFTGRLALDPGFAAPNAPNDFLVSRLRIVCQEGSCQRTGCSAKLDPLLGLPTSENTVKYTAHEAVTAANAVQNMDSAGLYHVPLVTGQLVCSLIILCVPFSKSPKTFSDSNLWREVIVLFQRLRVGVGHRHISSLHSD